MMDDFQLSDISPELENLLFLEIEKQDERLYDTFTSKNIPKLVKEYFKAFIHFLHSNNPLLTQDLYKALIAMVRYDDIQLRDIIVNWLKNEKNKIPEISKDLINLARVYIALGPSEAPSPLLRR